MEEQSTNWLGEALPPTATLALVLVTLFVARYLLERGAERPDKQFRAHVTMLALTGAGLLAVVLTLPDGLRGQLLQLIGIILSAAIALSATTFLGNAMAGVMLRTVRNFKMGDFVRVEDHFGRVTERGLFHTEIQTEFSDLCTLPNLFLVTHPVTVVRSSGTILTSTVSLGYDVSRTRVEELLVEAARQAQLEDPFVHVEELGDYSVTYRIAGKLTDVKQILSARSRLRSKMLDTLHEGGVEIVSPSFMNQRQVGDQTFVPEGPATRVEPEPEKVPEQVIFDKAEAAQLLQVSRDELSKLEQDIAAAADGTERARLEGRREALTIQIQLLETQLAEHGSDEA